MKVAITLSLLLIHAIAFCQTEPIITKGQVKENAKTPIPFAAIFMKKTSKGVYADSLGNFTINTKMGDTLYISAIGFRDTSFIAGAKNNLPVYLKRETNTLSNVKVTARNKQPSALDMQQPSIIDQQIIGNALSDYKFGNEISNGNPAIYTPSTAGSTPRTSLDYKTIMTTAPPEFSKYYNGALLPVFMHKEETQGSPYLIEKWAQGYVVNASDALIDNKSYWFNFDKLSQNLLMTQDKKNMVEVDRKTIKSFDIRTGDKDYVFDKKKFNGEERFFQVLAKASGKYTLYKSINTKFEKANYQSTGLTESGHNYDLYIDKPVYYIYTANNNQLKQIDFKKKSIKEAMLQDQSKGGCLFFTIPRFTYG